MSEPRVVVTGAAGLIGGVLWKNLVEGWELVGIDKRPHPAGTIVKGDMLDRDALSRLMNDMPFKAIVEGDREGLDPERLDRISHEWPMRPDSAYGVSKAFGEALGQYYAEVFGLEVLCVRIGTVNEGDRPLSPRQRATLLTHRDLTALIEACLNVEKVSYAVLYGVSANTRRLWDLEEPRRVLGWIPEDNAEDIRTPT